MWSIGRWSCHAFLAAAFASVDVVFHALAKLVQQECSFKSHLQNGAIKSHSSDLRLIVGRLYLVQSSFELNAFPIVCLFDTGCKGGLLGRRRCVELVLLQKSDCDDDLPDGCFGGIVFVLLVMSVEPVLVFVGWLWKDSEVVGEVERAKCRWTRARRDVRSGRAASVRGGSIPLASNFLLASVFGAPTENMREVHLIYQSSLHTCSLAFYHLWLTSNMCQLGLETSLRSAKRSLTNRRINQPNEQPSCAFVNDQAW